MLFFIKENTEHNRKCSAYYNDFWWVLREWKEPCQSQINLTDLWKLISDKMFFIATVFEAFLLIYLYFVHEEFLNINPHFKQILVNDIFN